MALLTYFAKRGTSVMKTDFSTGYTTKLHSTSCAHISRARLRSRRSLMGQFDGSSVPRHYEGELRDLYNTSLK
ncbi:unnamed protein product [Acanthoscelides obtectus]|uniref:Uncharacterized protein n=1 Tax=Acanthoscelides obtectus TaxID=200917 RepID=A0A9P0K1T3_ACAOB|nr:unnamed protein product [Acanthoscelides obtectus]CAK1647262.1 hypothetical protein AOBTE_LOCUS15139 [Acanthoscelides obtectus]